MKKNFIFSLSLALLASPAAFAATSADETPTLPAFVVTAERVTPLERAVADSLAEFAASAHNVPSTATIPVVPAMAVAKKSSVQRSSESSARTLVAAKG